MTKRFLNLTEEENYKKTIIPTNTNKSNKSAADTLRIYLKEKQQDTDFEEFEPERLAEVLGHIYMNARTTKGELYTC